MRPPVLFTKALPGCYVSGPVEPKVPFKNILFVMADTRHRSSQKGAARLQRLGACGANGDALNIMLGWHP